MKAVVHIGMPKTGTSSIQYFLGGNIGGLAAQGFHYQRNFEGRLSQFEYPMCAFERLDLHLDSQDGWSRYAVGDRDRQRDLCRPILADLKTYPSRSAAHTALFSSEHIFAWLQRPQVIASFHDMMSEVFEDVRYIVYLRDPVSLLPSRYSEGIKRGKTQDLDALVETAGAFKGPVQRLGEWCGTAGRDHVSIRLFDSTFLLNGDLIDDFCSVAGIDAAPLERPPRVNESLSAVGAEALRALNAFIPEVRPNGSFNGNRDGFLPEIMKRTKDMPPIVLTDAQRARVRQKSKAALDRLQRTYFPHRDPLFKPAAAAKGQPPEEIRAQALSLLAELLAHERATARKGRARQSGARTLLGLTRRTVAPLLGTRLARQLRGARTNLLRRGVPATTPGANTSNPRD